MAYLSPRSVRRKARGASRHPAVARVDSPLVSLLIAYKCMFITESTRLPYRDSLLTDSRVVSSDCCWPW